MEIRLLDGNNLDSKHYEELFYLADKWWKEISTIPLSKESVYNLIDSLKDTSLFYVDKSNRLVAYVGIVIHPHIFNNEFNSLDVISFIIRDECRNSKLFLKIMKDISTLAYKYNIVEYSISFFDNIKEKSMFKLGFNKKETVYSKVI